MGGGNAGSTHSTGTGAEHEQVKVKRVHLDALIMVYPSHHPGVRGRSAEIPLARPANQLDATDSIVQSG
jgi:hypothetical protein